MTLLLLLLLACTGEGPSGPDDSACVPDGAESDIDPACDCYEPEVKVGGGADHFEEVADGAAVTMVHGPQGGWHVLGSARISFTVPLVRIHYEIEVPGRAVRVSDNNLSVMIVEDSACSGYYPGMYGYLDVSAIAEGEADTPPEVLAGETIVLRMTIEDAEGRTATDDLSAVAALDPMDTD